MTYHSDQAVAQLLVEFGLGFLGGGHCTLARYVFILVRAGHAVLFTAVSELVEKLLEAKRDLRLSRELQRLDRFACLALDDIGYVQQDRSEMEVLFTLLAARYERRSVMITSNLVFSKWDQIFKDPMTTAAAIERVVHHSVILELTVPSYRAEAAQRRVREKPTKAA